MTNSQIKILFLIGSFGVGGKERQLAEIINNLNKNKYEIALYCKEINNSFLQNPEKDISKLFKTGNRKFSLKDIQLLRDIINDYKPDVIYSWATFTSHLALMAAITSSKPVLINASIQNAPAVLTPKQIVESKLFNLYKYVVANSKAGLRAYGQLNKRGRFVLYNGYSFKRVKDFDKNALITSLGIKPGNKVITSVARLDKFKDHATLLKAAKLCLEKDPNIIFLLAGVGNLQQYYKTMAKELGIEQNVHFLGYRTDVEELLQISDLSLLISTPKYGEGISNSIIESMAVGTPVIATDNPGNRELILDGKDGFIVENKNPEAIAEKVFQILDCPMISEQLIQQAKAKVSKIFDLYKMIEDFENILRITLRDR